MFGKLIKYEFRATRRVMLPLIAAVIALSPLVGLCVKAADPKNFGSFIISILNGAFTVAVIGVIVASFILMIRRFHSSFLSDEGYLTFTLPVRTSSLVFAKLIASFAWFVAAILSCTVSGLIIGCLNGYGPSFSTVGPFLKEASRVLGTGNIILYFAEALILMFLFSCFVSLHFYAAMALGHSFSGHKTLLSVCFYVVLSMAMTFLTVLAVRAIGNGHFIAPLLDLAGDRIIQLGAEKEFARIPHICSGIAALWLAFSCALYYVPTILPLNKRLNLN